MDLFDTPVGMVLDLIALIQQPSKFLNLIKTNLEIYKRIHIHQKDLLTVYTSLTKQIEEELKGGDLVTFIEQLAEEKLEEGIALGRKEVLAEMEEKDRQSAILLLKSKVLPSIVSDSLKMPLSQVLQLQKSLENS